MGRRPRTRAELADAESRAWEEFNRKLNLIGDFDQARGFGNSGPRSWLPGGQYYTNLMYFLNFGSIPDGASEEACALYRELSARIKAGESDDAVSE